MVDRAPRYPHSLRFAAQTFRSVDSAAHNRAPKATAIHVVRYKKATVGETTVDGALATALAAQVAD